MNPFQSLLKSADNGIARFAPTNPALLATPDYQGRATGVNLFGFGQYKLELQPAENPVLLQEGLTQNHYVAAIVDWKASRFAEAIPRVCKINNKNKLSKYKSLTRIQQLDSYVLRKDALCDVDDHNDPLYLFFEKPNPLQSWYELAYNNSIYYDFGNSLNWGIRLQSGPNAGRITELYPLPVNSYMGHEPSVLGYKSYVHTRDPAIRLAGEDVLHIRRFNPRQDVMGGTLWGYSKLAAGKRLLDKSTAAMEAEAEVMQNRGARTILFPKGQVFDVTGSGGDSMEQAAANADAVRRKLTQAGTGGIAMTSYELSSIQLGLNLSELNTIPANKANREELCGMWHIHPNTIFGTAEGGSLGGNKEQETNAQSIRAGVIPDVKQFYAKVNNFISPSYGPDYHIDVDINVYPELQADYTEMAAWADSVPMTGDDRMELFGRARTGLPEMQIPLIKNSLVPVSDFAAPKIEPNAIADPNSAY